MALLLTCQSLTKSYGAEPLFENVSLTVSDGERVGLIGPNGAGKSTFLEILAGLKETDSGESTVRKLVKLSYVPQDVAYLPELTARQILLEAVSGETIEEAAKGARAAAMLSLTGFSARESDSPAAALSGGWKKRLSIARALIQTPDILLLDEPTNHLDLEGILWLERLLAGSAFACIVVSHDRYFLENIATDMAELNRVYPGGMFRVKGNYSEFLVRRDDFLGVQARLQETLENKVRREVEWLRRGPKARTTKSKARIGAAGRLIEELAEVSARNETSTARIDFTASGRKTKSLIDARDIEKEMGGRTLFRGLRLALGPGVRMGLVGRNGSGKTTLLKILSGEIAPDAGTMERAEGLRVVSFDQNREQLDPDVTLRRALAPEGDSVIYRERVTHVASWARRFLFKPEQFEVPVGRLSGGERARVLIARLMLQPADVLLLDEPTNDLDIPTLEVLEESLAEFSGALVLVTHDRYLLDRVSTTVLGLDGDGGATMYADYSQWEQSQTGRKQPKAALKDEPAPAPAKKRLSYMEAREWETMEERVLTAEKLLEEKRAAIDAAAAAGDAARLRQSYDEMTAAQEAADRLYSRWAELEVKQV